MAVVRTTADALASLPRVAVQDACRQIEQLARSVGGTMHLGRTMARLSAVSQISSGTGWATATIHGTPTGPWVWITSGTAAHEIAVRSRRGGRGRPPALKLGGQFVAGPVQHPGTRGRGAWRQVQAGAERIMSETVARHVHEAVG